MQVRPRGPGVARGLQHALDLVVGEPRDHRREHHAHRHARPGERRDGGEPPRRRRRPGLQPPRQPRVERRHRHAHAHQPARRHLPEQIQVALHKAALRGQRRRVPPVAQHLEHLPGDVPVALRRLVGVGDRPDGDRRGPVARRGELALQRPGRAGPRHEPRLEVEPRREAQIGVRGPGVAVDAAVLAPPIRVHRAVEAQVGRGVARQDPPAGLVPDLGPRPGSLLRLVGHARQVEAPGLVAERAAARAAHAPGATRLIHGRSMERTGNPRNRSSVPCPRRSHRALPRVPRRAILPGSVL